MSRMAFKSLVAKLSDGFDELYHFLRSPALMEQCRIKPEEGSGLLEAVHSLAKTAGFHAESVKVYRVPTRFANAFCAPGHNEIFLTDGFIKLFNYHNLRLPPPPELKAIVAHEMGHLQQGYGAISTAQMPMSFAPAAGLSAAYLYQVAKPTDQPANAAISADDIRKAAEHEREEIRKSHPDSPQEAQQKQKIVTLGEMVAVGALGVAGCAALTRNRMLALEYGADAFAVHATKDPQAFIRGLQITQQRINADFAVVAKDLTKTIKEATFVERVKMFTKALQDILYREIYHAHPTPLQRFEKIRQINIAPATMQI